jgi:serine/threonine protein kinase
MEYQIDVILPVDHPTYIERAADNELIRYLKAGKFCYVFSSPQMGKSSLIMRAANELTSQGFVCAHVDSNNLISSSLPDEREWYGGFIEELNTQFNLGMDRDWFPRKWEEKGSQVLDEFIKEILLKKVKVNIVVFIDNLEHLLKVKFSLHDFWTIINRYYEAKMTDLEYKRLNFVPIGVATTSDLKIDNRTNPLFSNGQAIAIELTAFTEKQILPLMAGLPNISDSDRNDFIKKVLGLSGGQPVLIQKIFDIHKTSNLDSFNESLVRGMNIDSLLNRINCRLTRINSSEELLLVSLIEYLKMYDNDNNEIIYKSADPAYEELQISGVVIRDGGALRIFNPIYQDQFDRKWVQTELRNKRVIYRRYWKQSELGQGGFGRTFLVKDLESKGYPSQAIKQIIIPPAQRDSEIQRIIENFRREAEILERMDHERIPKKINIFEENQALFILQEYIEGITLERKFNDFKLKRTTVTECEIIEILKSILEVVSSVHKEGVIHRDIKPPNLIERNNQLVLIDFGAGKIIEENSLTQNARTISPHTLGYAAPEQLRYERATKASDIYAIGIIAIEAITNINPYKVLDTPENIINFNWRQQHPQIDVSENLGKIIDKMTCYEAKKRYQSAEDVLDELKKIGSTEAGPGGIKGPIVTDEYSHMLDKINKFIITIILLIVGFALFNNAVQGCFLDSIFCFRNTDKKDTQENPATSTDPKSYDPKKHISSGDKYIQVFGGNEKEQKKGIKLFNQGKYYAAYEEFYNLIKKYKDKKRPLDPCLLIYLNNSKVRYLHSLPGNYNKQIYKSVVMAPANIGTGKSIISGVALKQNIIVNGINKESTNLSKFEIDLNKAPSFYYEIIIADDQNIPGNAKTISEELSTDSSVSSVIGSYTSEVTCEAVKVFSAKGIPIISPNSELYNLRTKCDDKNKVFFRTVLSTEFEAKSLISELTNKQKEFPNLEIIALYKKGGSTDFSQDLFERFKEQPSTANLKLNESNTFNLEAADNEIDKIIEKIKNANIPTVIVLFPDGGTSGSKALYNAKKIINAIEKSKNKNVKLILGSNSLFSEDIAKIKDLGGTLLLAVDSTTDENCSKKEFVAMTIKILNGENNRIFGAYEATQVLTHLISLKINNKDTIKEKLNDINFSVPSEVYNNTNINFINGDRNLSSKLLVTPSGDRFGLFKPNQCSK